MPIIRFAINVPQEVRLQSLDARVVPSQFGGNQHLFSADEGIFYVSDKVGGILSEQFRKLGVKTGETVEITKAEIGAGPGRKTQWIVTAAGGDTPPSDEPPSKLEQQLAASLAMVEARKQAQRAPVAAPAAPAEQPAWARHLANQTRQLIDVYAEAVTYASQQHGNSVKPEDVRSMMTTLFINMSKNGGNAHAA